MQILRVEHDFVSFGKHSEINISNVSQEISSNKPFFLLYNCTVRHVGASCSSTCAYQP